MHPKNQHTSYDFDSLTKSHPELLPFVFVNEYQNKTIDFSKQEAVFHLNKALLKNVYYLKDWNLPKNYLCPPIPGRVDYLLHLGDILKEKGLKKNVKGLDIGMGANCIYSILGAQIFDWKMVGVDIDSLAVQAAKENVTATPELAKKITILHQTDPASIFKGIVQKGDYYTFSMCNPPFYSSKEDATKATYRKLKNLGNFKGFTQNFGGQANELWCNGGEALFIKRMIKESILVKSQIDVFSTLVSKKENLSKIYKQLDKLKAKHQTLSMEQGNKRSRLVAWYW